jgi:hypothetical protein
VIGAAMVWRQTDTLQDAGIRRTYALARRRIHPPCLGERAALTLVCAALICAVERRRAIRITEFEQRQLNTIREETHRGITMRNPPASLHNAPLAITL